MAHRTGMSVLHTRNIFVAVLALGLLAMASRNVTDPDVWWHLRTGQLTLANHAVFHADPYSFTRAGQPWINHEWLFDVLIFLLYRAAGFGGLIVTFAAVVAAGFMLLFWRCPGRPYIAALITIWAALASAPLWGVRPQMVSFLLASLVFVLRERAANRPALWWWMVPLTLLWVNLHAGYALGIALLAIFFAGEGLDVAPGTTPWPEAAPRLRSLGLVLLVCVATVSLNPYGVKMYGYPLATLRSTAMQRFIVEWFSPDFHQAIYIPLLLFLLATMAAVALGPRKIRAGELLLLCFTMFAALLSVRLIPIYLLVAAPLVSEAGQRWASRVMSSFGKVGSAPSTGKALLNATILAACLFFAGLHLRTIVSRQMQAEADAFPEATVSFLQMHPEIGPIFNSYDWGGYFIWKLYPQQRVFVDGRADVYGDAFLEDYSNTLKATHDWQKTLEQWQIRTVVIPPSTALAAALRGTGRWKAAYDDGRAEVLCRIP